MVSEHNKRIFRLIGEAKNPPIVKTTKGQWLKNFNFLSYLNFIQGSFELLKAFTEKKMSENVCTADQLYYKAKKLGLLKHEPYSI